MSSLTSHAIIISGGSNELRDKHFLLLISDVQKQQPVVKTIVPDGISIGIDEIKKVLQDVSLTSLTSGNRFIHIKEAEKLTLQAQNALLKVLEEPPPSTYFVLSTVSSDMLLPTICSRSTVTQLQVTHINVLELGESIESLFMLIDEHAKDKTQLVSILDTLIINTGKVIRNGNNAEAVLNLSMFLFQAREWVNVQGINVRLIVENCALGYINTFKVK